jgi:hypothetical protein
VSPTTTFITSHALTEPEPEANRDAHHRFAEYVAAHQPPLLDFQAYVSDDQSELKLIFVFPDAEASAAAQASEPPHEGFRDSRLAGLLAAAVVVLLFVVAVYAGSISGSGVA